MDVQLVALAARLALLSVHQPVSLTNSLPPGRLDVVFVLLAEFEHVLRIAGRATDRQVCGPTNYAILPLSVYGCAASASTGLAARLSTTGVNSTVVFGLLLVRHLTNRGLLKVEDLNLVVFELILEAL